MKHFGSWIQSVLRSFTIALNNKADLCSKCCRLDHSLVRYHLQHIQSVSDAHTHATILLWAGQTSWTFCASVRWLISTYGGVWNLGSQDRSDIYMGCMFTSVEGKAMPWTWSSSTAKEGGGGDGGTGTRRAGDFRWDEGRGVWQMECDSTQVWQATWLSYADPQHLKHHLHAGRVLVGEFSSVDVILLADGINLTNS